MKQQTSGDVVGEFNNSWKGRGNLQNLVKELERQKGARMDVVAETRNFRFNVREAVTDDSGKVESPGAILLDPVTDGAREWFPDGAAEFNQSALLQLAEKSTPPIPSRFMEAMTQQRPKRLADLLNGLASDQPARRFIRCLDGKVRGWLSDKYRVIDHYDIAFACLDAAQKASGEVFEAALSDRTMHLKFTSKSVWSKIDITQRGGSKDGWFAGGLGNQNHLSRVHAKSWGDLPGGPGSIHPIVTVRNSETGHGGLSVRIGILLGICFNVATVEDVISNIHLGDKMGEGVFTESTLSAESKAIYGKARDAVAAAFTPAKFQRMVDLARAAQSEKIEQPTAAIENVVRVGDIIDEDRTKLLEYFLRDYDQTRFGVAQAVSRLAQDTGDVEDAEKLESLSGKIILGNIRLVGAPKDALVAA